MELLEYQAKELFRQVGIPTLPSQLIGDARELKNLQVRYPIILKSQVHGGGRGKAGGVKPVQNTIDAIAVARNIFNLAIAGEYPEVLLAESLYKSEQEIFLAVVLDYELQRPVLLGSAHGGMEITKLLANLHQVVIEDFFSPFYARHLLSKMGFSGELVVSLSDVIRKMYDLLWAKSLEVVEINPLGIRADGELMALDGKVTVHETALRKYPELASFGDRPSSIPITRKETPLFWKHDVADGKIGIICLGSGAAGLIWDIVHDQKGHPACCWILGSQAQGLVFSPEDLDRQILYIVEQLKELPQIKVLLINLIADAGINEQVLRQFVTQMQQVDGVINRSPVLGSGIDESIVPSESAFPEVVIRCLPTIENPPENSFYWKNALGDAVQQTIALSKQKTIGA